MFDILNVWDHLSYNISAARPMEDFAKDYCLEHKNRTLAFKNWKNVNRMILPLPCF